MAREEAVAQGCPRTPGADGGRDRSGGLFDSWPSDPDRPGEGLPRQDRDRQDRDRQDRDRQDRGLDGRARGSHSASVWIGGNGVRSEGWLFCR